MSAVLDQVTGKVKIMATDLTLDGKQYTFDLRATSNASQDYYIDSFKVTLMDICGTVQVQPPQFAVSSATQQIWTSEDYYF